MRFACGGYFGTDEGNFAETLKFATIAAVNEFVFVPEVVDADFHYSILFFLSFRKTERTGVGTSLVISFMRNLPCVPKGDSA